MGSRAAFKRGQSYVTEVSDAMARRVIYADEGRGMEKVEAFSQQLIEKGGDCEKIRQVACDMSAPYMSGVDLCFPKATVAIDKFHVKQLMLKAMDQVRRKEYPKTSRAFRMVQCLDTMYRCERYEEGKGVFDK